MKNIHEVDGYGIVLSEVQNYYPVEEHNRGLFCWGFKYISGIFEFFYYIDRAEAEKARFDFIGSLNNYLGKGE